MSPMIGDEQYNFCLNIVNILKLKNETTTNRCWRCGASLGEHSKTGRCLYSPLKFLGISIKITRTSEADIKKYSFSPEDGSAEPIQIWLSVVRDLL